ncbi:MAG: hypothetical protein F4153_05185 [Acidimicrobiia bacterium]|nr:hypothetical protein [Acidimicrobiia bacterium]
MCLYLNPWENGTVTNGQVTIAAGKSTATFCVWVSHTVPASHNLWIFDSLTDAQGGKSITSDNASTQESPKSPPRESALASGDGAVGR